MAAKTGNFDTQPPGGLTIQYSTETSTTSES